MRSLLSLRHLRIAGFALGAVAVAGAAVVVTASASGLSLGFRPAGTLQQPASGTATLDQSTAASSVCGDFMAHFAVDLGKSQAQINSAFQKALGDTLADQVKSGQLTQAQAGKIKARLATRTPCALPASLAPRGGGEGRLGAYLQAYEDAAAAALGITPATLQADLKGGQSLSQIAAARNVSEADFRTRLVASLQPQLDAAVTAGKLTTTQEQAIVNRLKTGPLPLWSRVPRAQAPAASPASANA